MTSFFPYSILLLFVTYPLTHSLHSLTPSLTHSQSHSHKLLIFFPGVGFDEGRSDLILQNLHFIEQSRSNDLEISCLLSMYRKPPPSVLHRVKDICRVTYYPTGNYVAYLKTLEPQIIKFGGFTHVMILLDDVELVQSSFDFKRLLQIMDSERLMVASPRVEGAHCPTMHRNTKFDIQSLDNAVGHESEVVEIFASVFTMDGWGCWHDMMDPENNPYGWGYDYLFYGYCKTLYPDFKIGIIETMQSVHRREFGRDLTKENEMVYWRTAEKWIKRFKKERGIKGKHANRALIGNVIYYKEP